MGGELDAMIAKIRAIPGLARRAAPAVADAVRESFERQIDAGRSPEGKQWKPLKYGGGQPLVDAEKALVVVPVGDRIVCRVSGHIARHNQGRARGGIVRRILPLRGIPLHVARAIKQAVTTQFELEAKGGP